MTGGPPDQTIGDVGSDDRWPSEPGEPPHRPPAHGPLVPRPPARPRSPSVAPPNQARNPLADPFGTTVSSSHTPRWTGTSTSVSRGRASHTRFRAFTR